MLTPEQMDGVLTDFLTNEMRKLRKEKFLGWSINSVGVRRFPDKVDDGLIRLELQFELFPYPMSGYSNPVMCWMQHSISKLQLRSLKFDWSVQSFLGVSVGWNRMRLELIEFMATFLSMPAGTLFAWEETRPEDTLCKNLEFCSL